MIWHTDLKAINSPTFIVMILIPLFFVYIGINSRFFSLKFIGIFSIAITLLNFGFVMLQIYEIIPVAQGNIRSTLALTGNRPTGLFFNAFALGYAAIVTYAINIYLAKNLNGIKLKALYIFGTVLSALVIVLSGTRTPLLVVAIITTLIIIEKNKFAQNNSKLVSGLVASIVVIFPFLIILLGRYIENSNYATLNGRTLLWDCVTSRWQELVPMLYVPLFHYLPFLANRPADRGIFNFFLITTLWLIVLIQSENQNRQLKVNKD
jgi:hypothetical protein